MIVTLHLSAVLDAELRSASAPDNAQAPSRALRDVVSAYGLTLKPMFPFSRDLAPARIWHLECPNNKAGEIVETLLRTQGVEGAYTKPPDDLPSLP